MENENEIRIRRKNYMFNFDTKCVVINNKQGMSLDSFFEKFDPKSRIEWRDWNGLRRFRFWQEYSLFIQQKMIERDAIENAKRRND